MSRYQHYPVILSLTLILTLPLAASAQKIRLGPDGPVDVEIQTPVENIGAAPVDRRGEPRLSRIRLHPAAEPTPALKYSFVPNYLDLKPGNAAPYYYRAVINLGQVDRETRGLASTMSELAVVEIDTQAVDDILPKFSFVLQNIRVATHREHCDWQWRVRDLAGPEKIQFVLQEVQDLRVIGYLLSLKAANHLAKQEFEEAVDTITTGYRIAGDASKPNFLVNDLVGLSIANKMNQRVVEMIDMPGSPNLYWAISSLPRPLVSMKNSLEHEKAIAHSFFSFLREPEAIELTPEGWSRLVEGELTAFREAVGDWGHKHLKNPAALIDAVYPRAKRELIADGLDKERVNKMAPAQVVAIHESRELKRMTDSIFKWSLLPYHEAEDLADKASMRVVPFSPFGLKGESLPIGSLLLPAVAAATQAEIRFQTQVAGIRTVEAIRMQMAEDEGKLPARLSDVTVVPVPRNPATNEPFPYEEGVLKLSPGKNASKEQSWHLELQAVQK